MRPTLALILLLLAPAGAGAYDVFLDIDLDLDPRTINTTADSDTALIRLVLSPAEPGEWITQVNFGLGGTCWECLNEGVPYTYGTDAGIYRVLDGWHADNPLFSQSSADINLCYGCCNTNEHGEGFHYLYQAIAADGGFSLDEPVFITEFTAWVNRSHVFDRCPHPPADLVIFGIDWDGSDSEGNKVILSDEFTPVAASSWSVVKSRY